MVEPPPSSARASAIPARGQVLRWRSDTANHPEVIVAAANGVRSARCRVSVGRAAHRSPKGLTRRSPARVSAVCVSCSVWRPPGRNRRPAALASWVCRLVRYTRLAPSGPPASRRSLVREARLRGRRAAKSPERTRPEARWSGDPSSKRMHRRRSGRSCRQVRRHAARSAATSRVRPATSLGCAYAGTYHSQRFVRSAAG